MSYDVFVVVQHDPDDDDTREHEFEGAFCKNCGADEASSFASAPCAPDEDEPEKTWWSVDHFDNRADAEALVSDMSDMVHAAHGFGFSRLED